MEDTRNYKQNDIEGMQFADISSGEKLDVGKDFESYVASEPAQAVATNRRVIHKPKFRLSDITFNHEEPFFIAVKKIITQLAIVAVLIALLAGGMWARQVTLSALGNDDLAEMSRMSIFQDSVSVSSFTVSGNDSGSPNTIVKALLNHHELPSVVSDNLSLVPKFLYEQISDMVTTKTISFIDNYSNLDYLTSIYNSLDLGNPVLISLASADNKEIMYGTVTAMDVTEDVIEVVYENGKNATFTLEDFFIATRLSEVDGLSFTDSIAHLCGFYNINTAILINDTTTEDE